MKLNFANYSNFPHQISSVRKCRLTLGIVPSLLCSLTMRNKATIHQVTTTLATSENGAWAIIKVSGHQYRRLAGGYDLEIRHV